MNFLNIMKMQSPTMQLGICNCTKSNCTKKYCECYKSGRECSWMCRCVNCSNCVNRRDKIHCERYLIDAIGIQIVNNVISFMKREVITNFINFNNSNCNNGNFNFCNNSNFSDSKIEKNVVSENLCNVSHCDKEKNDKGDCKDKEKKSKKDKKNKGEKKKSKIGNLSKKHCLRELNKNKNKDDDKYKSNKKDKNSSFKKNKHQDIYTPMKMSNKKRLRNSSNFKTPINFSGNLTTTEKTNKAKNNINNKRTITKGKRLKV